MKRHNWLVTRTGQWQKVFTAYDAIIKNGCLMLVEPFPDDPDDPDDLITIVAYNQHEWSSVERQEEVAESS